MMEFHEVNEDIFTALGTQNTHDYILNNYPKRTSMMELWKYIRSVRVDENNGYVELTDKMLKEGTGRTIRTINSSMRELIKIGAVTEIYPQWVDEIGVCGSPVPYCRANEYLDPPPEQVPGEFYFPTELWDNPPVGGEGFVVEYYPHP